MPSQAAQDLDLLTSAARDAGTIARRFFNKSPQIWMKHGRSPVSEADIAVNEFLEQQLRSARPSYGWLSEESRDSPDRLQAQKVFIVDPIDGTRGFISGSHDWTISLAIVTMKPSVLGRPIAAALYNPMRDEMYCAIAGHGACLNGNPLKVSSRTTLRGSQFCIPNSLIKTTNLATHITNNTNTIASLAYRIALVAADRINAALARPNSHDWDLAAADLLLQEAGGILIDTDGLPIRYNAAEPKHGLLVAANKKLALHLLTLIK